MSKEIIDKGLTNRLEEIYGVECTMYYPERYAGTADCVGVYEFVSVVFGSVVFDLFQTSCKGNISESACGQKSQTTSPALLSILDGCRHLHGKDCNGKHHCNKGSWDIGTSEHTHLGTSGIRDISHLLRCLAEFSMGISNYSQPFSQRFSL